VKKLSVQTVQEKLLEAEKNRKVRWETLKKNARKQAVSSLNDPSTQITSVKQVKVPKEAERKSGTHAPFVLQAELAGHYVDGMDRGIFGEHGSDGAPHKTPSVKKMTPNQKSTQSKVSADMQKGSRKSESSNSQLWPAAEMATHYVDALPRGNIYSDNNNTMGGVKAPTAKNLHGTTRPKSSQKSANMDRHPMDHQPKVGEPDNSFPMPKDAPPKKRAYEKVRSGVLVRVNESVKAQFDIVSSKVLKRIEESYRKFGYKVIFEQSREKPEWLKDPTFLGLVYESVAAKYNNAGAYQQKLANAALNRLYQLCQSNYSDMYESREEFLDTLRAGLSLVLENAHKGL
jgi:hypothetical protein